MALVVIPARFNSSRFPGKPLALIENIPMVIRVYKQASLSKLAEKVIIATDDKRIFECALEYNCNVEMTLDTHESGTDRIAEVALKYDYNIVVNVQGDEPFIEPEIIDESIKQLQNDLNADIVTPIKKIKNINEVDNPNIVKVVFDNFMYAIYFSRSIIPHYREKINKKNYFKHIGLYAFRKDALEKFINLPKSNLENIEKLEQLRAIENQMKIKVFITEYESIGIDTPEDLKNIKLIKNKV